MPDVTARPSTYDFQKQLELEGLNKARADLVFMGHGLEDISSNEGADRKSGTDFLLSLRNSDGALTGPIRCENKFEQYWGGRVTLELVSVDAQRVPGWMYTSQAGWLLSWFQEAGDLLACPMDEVRDVVFANISRHQATTTRNKRYLTWSVLEDINYLLLNVKNSRFLDLRYELGDSPAHPSQVTGAARNKLCTSVELAELMRSHPFSSKPRPWTVERLEHDMRRLAPKNRQSRAHAEEIARLSFLTSRS